MFCSNGAKLLSLSDNGFPLLPTLMSERPFDLSAPYLAAASGSKNHSGLRGTLTRRADIGDFPIQSIRH
jgi:hypothetical protein